MDKAEEIFAEGIEDRNVKTIRQARVLFVICLMAGMFIIFESDDIFKWAAVLAVYFFTDSFYKKYLRVEANLADDMTGNDIYQFIGQHALSVDCYFGIISKKIRKYRMIFFAEYFLCAIFSDSKGYGLIIAVLSVVVTYATAWIKKKYFICRLVGKLKPVEMILTFTDSFLNIFKFLLILLVSLLFCVVFLGVADGAVEREMVSGQILERFIGIPAFFVMVVAGLIVPLAGYAFFKPSAILNAALKTAMVIGIAGFICILASARLWYYEINYTTQKITLVHFKEKQYDFSDVERYIWKSGDDDENEKTLVLYLKDETVLRQYEKKDWQEVIPDAEFPAPLVLESNIEYVRCVLGSTVNDTACRERYVDVRTNAPETFIRYQRMVNDPVRNVMSHTFIEDYIRKNGEDYRFEVAPNPVPELRDRTKDNICVGRQPLCRNRY